MAALLNKPDRIAHRSASWTPPAGIVQSTWKPDFHRKSGFFF